MTAVASLLPPPHSNHLSPISPLSPMATLSLPQPSPPLPPPPPPDDSADAAAKDIHTGAQPPAVPSPAESTDAAAAASKGAQPPDITLSAEPPLPAPPLASLLHLSFNQDSGCFAASTDLGFRIYNCHPFREIFRRDFGGGIAAVEMLFRCNVLALVGGGQNPRYPPSKVMIWDDNQGACIGELSFRSEVRAVRLRRDRVVVALDRSVFVYNFADLKLVQQIETVPNPRGLCAVSQQPGAMVLVCPGGQKGQLRVEHCGARRTKFIMAHDSRVACLALSPDGAFVATASSKGTLVRIFATADGTLLQEVRRGADRAEIYSLAFSADMQWLAVSSDKGTVHVFGLKVNSGSPGTEKVVAAPEPISPTPPISSSLSFIKGVLPRYFHSEWSLAQFHLREGSRFIVAFGRQKNTIVILGMDGSSYQCEFDPAQGGEMKQLECYNFLKQGGSFLAS